MSTESTRRRQFLKSLSLGSAAVLTGTSLAHAQAPTAPFAMKDFLPVWERAGALTIAFADAMPEEHYGYKPTDEVRSFAEQLLHIGGSCIFFGSKVSDLEPPMAPDAFSPEGKSKAQIKEMLETAFKYCAECIASLNDDTAAEVVPVFGEVTLPRKDVALFMRDHVTHHRGQAVIYLRMKGIAPPQYVGF